MAKQDAHWCGGKKYRWFYQPFVLRERNQTQFELFSEVFSSHPSLHASYYIHPQVDVAQDLI